MKVKCCDGIVLELEDALVYASLTVKQLIDEKIPSRRCFGVWIFDGKDENYEISFEKEISSKTLLKINEYVNKHADAASTSSNRISRSLRSWDLEFIKVDRHTLFALVLAAKYLQITDLINLSSETVRAKTKGKTPEKIHRYYNLKNDMTPQEEEEY